jgi:hypothetical protein
MGDNAMRRGLWLGASFLLLAAPLLADQPMSSANYTLYRDAAAAGGGWGYSAHYNSSGTVNELPLSAVAGSTSSSANYALGPGLMNIIAFPGQITNLSMNVFLTSATLQWNTPGYDGASGTLQPGTNYFIWFATSPVPGNFYFSNANITISTQGAAPGLAVSTVPAGLYPNATYYAGIWTEDARGDVSFSSNRSTGATLSFPPGLAAPTFTAVWQSSMSAQWTDGGNSASINQTTFTVVFTSDTQQTFYQDAWNGNVVSSTTALATNAPAGAFDDNTTYYLWAQSVNMGGVASPWVLLGATSSLTVPVTRLVGDYQYVFYTSATLQWAALPPHPPFKGSGEGYRIEASSTDFGALSPGGITLTSATPNVAVSSLTIDFTQAGLDSYTTWYFQVGALNHNSVWNPVALTRLNMEISGDSVTYSFGALPNVFQSTVSISSFAVTNLGNLPVTLAVWATTVTAGSPWTLSTSSGSDTVVLQGAWASGQPTHAQFSTAIVNSTTTSQNEGNYAVSGPGGQSGQGLPVGSTAGMWFQFWPPTGMSFNPGKQTFRVDVRPVYP